MDPQQELAQWVAFRHQFEQQFGQNGAQADPQLIDRYNGKSLSPQAWQLYQHGNGSQHYDITKGDQGGLANDKGWFSHPESWIQLGLGGAMGAGALGAFGGAGSAAGGGAGGAGSAGGGTAAAAASGELGIPTTMGLANGAGVGTQAAMPSMGDLSGLISGGTGAFDAAGNWVPKAIGGLDALPGGASTLLKALAGVGGLLGGKALANQGQSNAVPPQLQQLLDLSLQRANAQTPLFNAANKGLYDMLPTFAKNGGG